MQPTETATDAGSYRSFDDMTPWQDRLQLLEVLSVVDEAPEVKTFTFRSDPGVWFRYKPGQFVTLELPTVEHGTLFRTYTLSSSPSRPFSIAVTVKAQATSLGTRWMFDNLRPGHRIKAYGPAGNFTHYAHPAAKYLFLSAGSGITPMMSMLRWFSDCAPGTDVTFVSCVLRPEEIIFRKELELLGTRMPSLSLGFLVQERSGKETWAGYLGRIDAARLSLLSPDFSAREIFCCGPEAFMQAVQKILKTAGFDMARYHQESFGDAPPASVPEAPPLNGAGAEKAGGVEPSTECSVVFTLSGAEGKCRSGQTVLQVARSTGVRIAAACESGLCGTCKIMMRSGKVDMRHQGGILEDEVEEGYILACCSKPLTRVEVEI